MYGRRLSTPYSIIFFIVGLYLFIVAQFPTKVEITHTEIGIQAHIHRRAMLPPFRSIDVFIPNLQQAVIMTENISEGRPDYRVELADEQGGFFPIAPFFSSDYREVELLAKRLNSSIKGKYNFKSDNIIKHDSLQQFGFIMMLVSIVSLILNMLQKKSNTAQKPRPSQNRKPTKNSQNVRRTQGLSIPQKPKSEKEKYKNINDSIIK